MDCRVLYLNHTSRVSGAERSLILLLKSLPPGISPFLACPPGELAIAARAAQVPCSPIAGIAAGLRLHPVHTVAGVRDIARSALRARRLCRVLDIDLIHANSVRAGLIAAFARRLGGPPVVAHIRDALPGGARTALIGRLLAAGVSGVISNSRFTQERAPLAVRERVPCWVVHNPVDLDQFDPSRVDPERLRKELGIPASTHVLAVVAQITAWKGQDTAIKVLADLLHRGHDAHLLLVGAAKFVDKATSFDNRAYLRGLRRLADDLGVTRHVTFLGEREDVPAIMSAADVLLVPSWQEPFGRCVIEAMAMGTPVLATNNGGTVDIITNGVDGVLLPPHEADRWTSALDALLPDAPRRQRMGAAARTRARAFRARDHAHAVLDVYASLLGSPSGPVAPSASRATSERSRV